MRSRSRRHSLFTGLGVFILILGIGAGLLAYQSRYIKKHLPLIESELAAAEQQGPGLLEEIGHPVGTSPYDEGEKTFPEESHRSMWRAAKVRVTWRRMWESPGDYEKVEGWYRDRLTALGWQPFAQGVPSSVEMPYWKDKWLLTFQRQADFSTDREPKVRYALLLEWDYWHDLGR